MHIRLKFTLVELLVVISIIILLAGLLLPALKSAKDKASQIKCAGNLRQTGYGFISYTGDYNGYFPYSHIPDWCKAGYSGYWYRVLTQYWPESLGYITGRQVEGRYPASLYCPSSNSLSLYGQSTAGNYGVNAYLSCNPPKSIDRLTKVSSGILLMDGDDFSIGYDEVDDFAPRHSGKCNIVFVDCHVDKFKKSDIPYTPAWSWKPYIYNWWCASNPP